MSNEFNQLQLGEIFEISRGGICPFLYPDEEFIHHSLPAFDQTGGPVTEFGKQIESNKTLITNSVVLLSKLNPRTCRVTTVDPLNSTRRHCCSTEFVAYRAKDDSVADEYYKYFFASDEFRNRLQNSAIGTTNSHVRIKPSETLAWEVPCPPKPEQTKIAEILSTVDRAIEQTEALIAKQQRLKTGLMQDLLTRGIDEHGRIRSEETHEFRDSPLGRIPVEWEVSELDDCAEFITSGSRGWAQYYATEGPLFLRIGNLTRLHIDMRFEDVVRVNPPDSSEGRRTGVIQGDLLISITADLGVIGVIPAGFEEAYVNQHIALVRLDQAEVDPRFIGWFLTGRPGQSQFENLNESGAKAGLNLPTIRRLRVARPHRAEQSCISQALDSIQSKVVDFEKRLTKLRSIKIALMQDLLTGRRRVTQLLDGKEAPRDHC